MADDQDHNRTDRLSAALRANLKRRKQQARARSAPSATAAPDQVQGPQDTTSETADDTGAARSPSDPTTDS